MDAFYFGARPPISLSRMLGVGGCRIVHVRYTKGVISSEPACRGVVLDWKTMKDQQVIAEAKAAGLPIVVVTAHLANAIQAGSPLADIYLEKPVPPKELSTLLLDMMTAIQQASPEVVS